jgi:peptidoglycan/LPS O-acetylase OafA/YrhL
VSVLPGDSTVFTKLCKIRALAWVGERSYGIYLWHWPVLLVVLTFIPASPDSVWSGWVAAAIVIFTTLYRVKFLFISFSNNITKN